MITVYTANLGNFDNLRPSQWCGLAFIDSPPIAPAPWITVPALRLTGDPARDVRLHKLLPHEFLGAPGGYSIWHDANFVLALNPEKAVSQFLIETDADIAVFRHPGRGNLFDEADTCAREGIEDAEVLRAQTDRYRAAGFPLDYGGLAACGVLIRRDSPKMREFGEAWWAEVRDFGRRDQIAFPFLCWKFGVKVAWIPGNIYSNPWFVWHWHAWKTDHEHNQPFLATRAQEAARLDRLKKLCERTTA